MLKSPWRTLLICVCLAVAALAAIVVLGTMWTSAPKAPPLDLSLEKTTPKGVFVVSLAPETGVIRQGELLSFVLAVKTVAGAPVANATIGVDGGMPAHSHGLPTAPRATAYLGEGRYRIEGVKFSMSGHWELRFAISAAEGADDVTFNLML